MLLSLPISKSDLIYKTLAKLHLPYLGPEYINLHQLLKLYRDQIINLLFSAASICEVIFKYAQNYFANTMLISYTIPISVQVLVNC